MLVNKLKFTKKLENDVINFTVGTTSNMFLLKQIKIIL